MFKSIRLFLISLIIILCSYDAESQKIDLKTLRGIVFASSTNQIDSVLRTFGYSYLRSGKMSQNGTQYEYVHFENLDYENNTKEVIAIFKDTSIMGIFSYDVKYISHSDKLFYELKNQCEKIKDAKFLEEKTDSKCYVRYFKGAMLLFAFSICEASDGLKNYSVNIHFGF